MNPFGFDPTKNPFAEIGKMLEQFKLPGLDLAVIMEAQRKNIEALTQANQMAYAGIQELARHQAALLQQTMTQCQTALAQVGSPTPANMGAQAEVARQIFDQAVAGMREMAEAAAKSQAQAWEVIQKRTQESVAQLMQQNPPK